MEVLIKNQNKSNSRLCDTKKKVEQGSIIDKTNIYKVKANVSLINFSNTFSENYIDCVYKKIIATAIVVKVIIMTILITIIINLSY